MGAGKIRLICFSEIEGAPPGTAIWTGREIVAVEINNGLYCKYHVIGGREASTSFSQYLIGCNNTTRLIVDDLTRRRNDRELP